MILTGECNLDNKELGIVYIEGKEPSDQTSNLIEIILYKDGLIWSAYKKISREQGKFEEFAFNNKDALKLYNSISKGLSGCTAKNAQPAPFELGVVSRHVFSKTKIDYIIDKFNKELAGAEIRGKDLYIHLSYNSGTKRFDDSQIPYVVIGARNDISNIENLSEADAIQVRTLEEIALEKDITWLAKKKYFIVNDDSVAEQIFDYLDNYNGLIAYDTETTGLRINMFSKINSSRKRELEEYNKGKPASEQIRADRLVGIIFCVEPDVSYYFPCFNRKFKNLYEDKDSPIRNKLIQNIKSSYTIGKYRDTIGDMASYWRDTPDSEITSDCILMERCRNILTTKKLATHNGTFEWKVSYCYDIDIRLAEDSLIMHQLMYKFRSTTANSGEPSNLKYLSKVELGIDQLDLSDFFADYSEDDSGTVRSSSGRKGRKKKSMKIDFSYMDYRGARAYAPTDGDATLSLCIKYKKDMIENHREMEYIYNVELIVACAIGYMEFYGHRIDEQKIAQVRDANKRKLAELEHKIRIEAKLNDAREDRAFKALDDLASQIKVYDDIIDTLKKELESNADLKDELEKQKAERISLFEKREEAYKEAVKAMNESENKLNLASPAQVAKLFFTDLGIPFDGEKPSVGKKILKAYTKKKNEDGTPKYPIIILYQDWKKIDTLLTKFFENLTDFMYPGGFIFSSFGQISTATGRMNAKKPRRELGPCMVTCG